MHTDRLSNLYRDKYLRWHAFNSHAQIALNTEAKRKKQIRMRRILHDSR